MVSVLTIISKFYPNGIFFLDASTLANNPFKNSYFLVLSFLLLITRVGFGDMIDYLMSYAHRLFTVFGKDIYMTVFFPFYSFKFWYFSHGKDTLLGFISSVNMILLFPVFIRHSSMAIVANDKIQVNNKCQNDK